MIRLPFDVAPPLWKDLTLATGGRRCPVADRSDGVLALSGWSGAAGLVAPALEFEPLAIGARPIQRKPFFLKEFGQHNVTILKDLHFYRHPVRIQDAAHICRRRRRHHSMRAPGWTVYVDTFGGASFTLRQPIIGECQIKSEATAPSSSAF